MGRLTRRGHLARQLFLVAVGVHALLTVGVVLLSRRLPDPRG